MTVSSKLSQAPHVKQRPSQRAEPAPHAWQMYRLVVRGISPDPRD
jgi:hypothetical protein